MCVLLRYLHFSVYSFHWEHYFRELLISFDPRQIESNPITNKPNSIRFTKRATPIVFVCVFYFFTAANLPVYIHEMIFTRSIYHKITIFGWCAHVHVWAKSNWTEQEYDARAHTQTHTRTQSLVRPWWKCFFRRISSSCVTTWISQTGLNTFGANREIQFFVCLSVIL